MRLLVVDACAALEAALSREGFALLAGHAPAAPPLLWSEAVSALHEMRWRGDLSPALGETALGRLLDAPIRRENPASLRRRAWEVAEDLGWAKTYDAEYVALAAILGCPLLTIDGRMKATASRLVKVLGPADL